MKITAIAFALMLAAAPVAAQMQFSCELNGDNNVPPIPAVTATGTGTFILNADHTELSYHIEYTGLSSPEIAAHFHVGGPRENGGAVFALPVGTPKDGVWAIPPEQVANLLDGRLYVNIHSELYVAGEIRGNIMPDEVGNEETTWGALKALYIL
jgi:hypothetical protein